MFAVYKLEFSDGLPEPDAILKERRRATGIQDIEYLSSGKNNFIVSHHLFQKLSVLSILLTRDRDFKFRS